MKAYNNQSYQDAIILFKEAYEIDLKIEKMPKWAQRILDVFRNRSDYSRLWLASSYFKLGDREKAKELDDEYMIEPYDRKLVEVADSLYNSQFFLTNADAISVLQRICMLDSLNLGENSFRYASSLYDLGCKYNEIHDFEHARHFLEKAFHHVNHLSKGKELLYSSVLEELAQTSYMENDIIAAIHHLELGLEFESDQKSINIALYERLATYYSEIGNWEGALEMERKRIRYWKNAEKKDFFDDVESYYSLKYYAMTLVESGNYKQAIRYYTQLRERQESYCSYCESLADLYYHLRDFDKALEYYQLALDSCEAKLPLDSLSYYSIVNGMARVCAEERAIQMQEYIVEKMTNMVDTLPNEYGIYYNRIYTQYAAFLSNLARYYNLDAQFDNAIQSELKSLKIKNKYYPQSNEDVAYSYLNLGEGFAGKKEWKKALHYLRRGYATYKRIKNRALFVRSVCNIISLLFQMKDYSIIIKYVTELMTTANEDLLSTFQELTYEERSRYIERYSDIMSTQIPLYAYYTQLDSLVSSAFDASLMMKGALLNSEKCVKRLIDESDDDSLSELWEELRAYKYIQRKQLEKDSVDRKFSWDSLQNKINLLEDSLVVKCKGYGDITRELRLKWSDMQEALQPNAIAIEFLSFPINNDSVMYAALTLNKDSQYPKMTVLFEEKQLKQVSDTLYFQCQEMTDLVWKPLQSELQRIKNIYFSPSGALYNIGIEYLPGMEEYNIYRLSSTRELVTKQKDEYENRAVLYGGLDYDAQLDSLSKPKSHDLLDFAFVERANVETVKRGMKIRGGQERLKHTQEEVEQIGETLRKAEWSCLLDTAAIGTEESFIALSGKRIGCLHLATHGFYYTPEEADNRQYKFMQLDNQHISAEDKALTRSGLLLSGANHILEGDTIPDDVEDGILTAKEIADVDLRGLDLVVLSACQTGLGDIAQGEGVFGLQRGFKKAGANSILMSLWEVEDKASQILMTQFYKNLLAGQGKHQALISAQKYLREYEGGKYDEPKYWAAFILLDGLK